MFGSLIFCINFASRNKTNKKQKIMERKIYIAKTLVEDIDLNSCSVEVFESRDSANEWSSKKIDSYVEDYSDPEVIKEEGFYRMMSGDTYVTIEVEEKSISK